MLFHSPFKVVAAKDHPDLAGVEPGAPLPLDLFCRLPQALRSIDGSLSGWTDEELAAVGRERRVVLALPQFQAVALAVAQTRLIAVLPTQFVERVASDLGFALYEPPVAVGVPEISMYWQAATIATPPTAGCATTCARSPRDSAARRKPRTCSRSRNGRAASSAG